jgi:hypothetical protein
VAHQEELTGKAERLFGGFCAVYADNKEEVMSNSEDEIAGPGGTCETVKDDGSKCRAPARQASRYCFFHDPTKEAERREAQQRGGRANRATVLPGDAPDLPLNSLKDIVALYARIINLQQKGEVSPKEASSLGYNFCQLAGLLEGWRLEERVAALEKAQKIHVPQAPLLDPFADE